MVKLIDVPTAARRLGVGESTIRRMIKSGKLPHCRVGAVACIRVPSDAVESLLTDMCTEQRIR